MELKQIYSGAEEEFRFGAMLEWSGSGVGVELKKTLEWTGSGGELKITPHHSFF